MRVALKSALIAAGGLLLFCAAARGQNYSGTYTTSNQQGGTVTLTLQQDAQGKITGTMAGAGSQFQVEGMLQEDVAVGAIYNDQGGVYFEADLDGAQLALTLIEPGADKQPDYSRTRQLILARATAGPAAPAAPQPRAGGNPLAARGGSSDPFAGGFAGDGVSLELAKSGAGYTGTLTVQGQAFPLTAAVAGSRLSGKFTAGGQDYPFEASLQGQQLVLSSDGSTYRLTRQADQGQGPANPLRRPAGGAPTGAAAPSSGSLIGGWSCQTAGGPAQLRFTSERELSFNGEVSQYQLAPGVVRVAGEWGPVEYRYRLAGDELSVTGPDGSEMRCRRQGGAAEAVGGAAGGGQVQLLRGRLCSFSSSMDGGYSTTRMLTFDGQGRFTTGTETSFNVPEGFGYGANRGNVGTYRVMGATKGAEIYLTFPDGTTGVAQVYHVYQGMITEIQFNGNLYGASICE